eukprot:scaffold3319_cov139-Skeletonema_menzelii.AAC.1
MMNKRIKTSDAAESKFSDTITVCVPTFTDKKVKRLDLQSMNEEDLKFLKKEDPFFYYSIPGVNKAVLSLEKVDHSKASQSADIVTRKGRLSFECYPSLALDELFLNEMFGSGESDLDELGDLSEFLFKTQ